MKRIIRLKQGDIIPENAKFLYAKEEKDPTKPHRNIREGLFVTREITYYETSVYFYYEVDEG